MPQLYALKFRFYLHVNNRLVIYMEIKTKFGLGVSQKKKRTIETHLSSRYTSLALLTALNCQN